VRDPIVWACPACRNRGAEADLDFHDYVSGIAEARYAIRKVFRIVDEQARTAGLDPLEHQALIQVYGSAEEMLPVSTLAARLDISPAFASRVARRLEAKGYIVRRSSDVDRRVTETRITEQGRELVRSIDAAVRVHVDYFQQQLTAASKGTALSIFGFYIGVDLPPDVVWGLVAGSRADPD